MLRQKKIILASFLFLLLVLALPDFSSSDLREEISEEQSSIQTNDIINDGTINIDEYRGYELIDATSNFELYYDFDGETIFFAMTATATGYLSIGFGSPLMAGSDIIMGYVDGTVEVADMIGTGQTFPKLDTIQNLLSASGSEISGKTTIEFSRLLDTGDGAEDVIINPGTSIDIIWAIANADNYISYHTARGILTLTFNTFVPRVPKNFDASPGDGYIDLNWETPTDGGSPITKYNIYRSLESGINFAPLASTSNLSYTDTGVINGNQYYYKITAENANGESDFSKEKNSIPSQSVTPPRNLTIITGDQFVQLNWLEPINDAGFPVIGYLVYKSNNSGLSYDFIGYNQTRLGFTDFNVINGEEYYYYVTANNSQSISGPSPSAVAYPVGRASVPLFLIATPGNNSVFLNWSAPLTNGGYPILNYSIFRSQTVFGSYLFVGYNSTTWGFNDTTAINLQTYYYTVSANNFAGASDNSTIVTIKVAKIPFSVTNITVAGSGNGFVFLTWNAADGNGFPINGYNIYRSYISGGNYDFIGNSTTSSYNDTTLTNGDSNYYVITGLNDNGEGVLSEQVIAIAGTSPSPPRNLMVQRTLDGVSISWIEPFDDGGFNIDQYHLYRAVEIDGIYEQIYQGNSSNYDDQSIIIGTSYYFTVSAENVRGEGSTSDPVMIKPTDAPTPPVNFQLQAANGTIMGSWENVLNDGGNAIVEYRIYRSQNEFGVYSFLGKNTSSLSFNDTQVIPGLRYYYKISAVNNVGESQQTDDQSIILYSAPTEPLNLIGVSANQQAGLAWSPPLSQGGFENVTYNIYRSIGNNENYEKLISTNKTSFIDHGLENDEEYYYRITSLNSIGESGTSNEVVVIPVIPPITTTNNIVVSSEVSESENPENGQNDENTDPILPLMLVGAVALLLLPFIVTLAIKLTGVKVESQNQSNNNEL